MKKIGTLPNDAIHIPLGCVVHLHGHQNKVIPLMNPFIIADLSNDVKFCNCTCWLTNGIRNHYLSHQINNHHISNENLVFSNHVKINL
jgi:hypothetical protein